MIGAFLAVAGLEVRQVLHGKKVLAAALLVAGAACLGYLVRRFARDPGPETWPLLYLFMMTFLFLHTLAILIPLLLSTSLIREETDEGTLVYLFTRPLQRSLVLLAKFVASLLISLLLIVAGMSLFHLGFTLPGRPEGVAYDWAGALGGFLRAGVLGVLAYSAVFTFVGLVSKRALIFGIAYGFLSEFLLTLVPAVIRKATLMHYIRSIALSRTGTVGDQDMDRVLGLADLTGPTLSASTLLGAAACFLLLSMVLVSVREFAEYRGAEAS